VLREHGIEEQAFYSGALIGVDCNRFLDHHVPILSGFEAVMRDEGLRRQDTVVDINDRITKLIGDLLKLMQVLDVLVHYLGQTEPLEAPDIERSVSTSASSGEKPFPSRRARPSCTCLSLMHLSRWSCGTCWACSAKIQSSGSTT